MSVLIADGVAYDDLIISVKRSAEMKESDTSGYMLDGSYFSDKIGTYLSYSVKVAVPVSKEAVYAELYEVITDPVGSHAFTLPYNQDTVNITGRVEGVSDAYVRQEGSNKIWRQIEFEIVSNYPTKQYTLNQVIQMGMQVKPDGVTPTEGDVFQYTGGTWVQLNYSDADEVYY